MAAGKLGVKVLLNCGSGLLLSQANPNKHRSGAREFMNCQSELGATPRGEVAGGSPTMYTVGPPQSQRTEHTSVGAGAGGCGGNDYKGDGGILGALELDCGDGVCQHLNYN